MILEIRVVTNSATESIEEKDGVLKVKVRAKPVGGEANKAVLNLLAQHFNVSRNKISIISGLKSRKKVVEIT